LNNEHQQAVGPGINTIQIGQRHLFNHSSIQEFVRGPLKNLFRGAPSPDTAIQISLKQLVEHIN